MCFLPSEFSCIDGQEQMEMLLGSDVWAYGMAVGALWKDTMVFFAGRHKSPMSGRKMKLCGTM